MKLFLLWLFCYFLKFAFFICVSDIYYFLFGTLIKWLNESNTKLIYHHYPRDHLSFCGRRFYGCYVVCQRYQHPAAPTMLEARVGANIAIVKRESPITEVTTCILFNFGKHLWALLIYRRWLFMYIWLKTSVRCRL